MTVVASWGSPVPNVWAYAELPSDLEPQSNQVYEMEFSLTSTPRDPTPAEAYAIFGEFVRTWKVEHPEAEMKYLEITRGSPQHLRIQFIAHSPFPFILIALAFIALVEIIGITVALQITLALIIVYAALRIVDYLVPGPEKWYRCPVCGAEFVSYGELVYHMGAQHPGVPVPTQEEAEVERRGGINIVGTIALVAIALGGAYAFFKWVLPAIRHKEKPPEKK